MPLVCFCRFFFLSQFQLNKNVECFPTIRYQSPSSWVCGNICLHNQGICYQKIARIVLIFWLTSNKHTESFARFIDIGIYVVDKELGVLEISRLLI